MHLDDTLIEAGGVVRCCLATVAAEFECKDVEIGATSECQHCHTKFKLVAPEDALQTCYHNPTRPIWTPRWKGQTP
jgi:hypothetical protein